MPVPVGDQGCGLGDVNYTVLGHKPGQGANLEQIADEAVAMFLRPEA